MPVKQNKNAVNKSISKKTAAATTPTKEAIFTVPKWTPVAVIVVTGMIYLRALQNGITNIDDDYYILNNPYIRDFSLHGIWKIFTSFYSYNYHPFTSLTNLIEYKLFELNPLPYHFFNVVLHLLNTWLVFVLANHLSGKRITALVVCILFALHPMHVESVAWLSERKDVLYAAFYIASLIAYLKYLESGLRPRYYVSTLLLFTASLFSKSAAVTLPAVLIIIDIYKNRKISTRSLLEKAPLFMLSLLFGILAIASQEKGGAISNIAVTYGSLNRIFVFTTGLASYFTMLAMPVRLAAIHYFPNVVNGMLPWYYYLSVPFLAFVVWLVFKKSRARKDAIFGFTFFLITISVMLQVVTVGLALYAERYSYISYIGFFYFVGQWISNNIQSKYKNVITGGGAIIVLLFAIQTWSRIGVWVDTEHVFADILEKNPGNLNRSYLYWYWGTVKKDEGNLKDALELFTNSIFVDSNSFKAHTSRGSVYEAIGDVRSAIKDYNKAIALKPKEAINYNLRGWALFQLHDTAAAMKDYSYAILLDPKYAEAYNNRGWAYYQGNDSANAVRDFGEAIQLDPRALKPYFNRAALFAGSGNLKAARIDYDSILAYHPTDSMAYYNRGIIRLNLADTPGACSDWRKAVEYGNDRVRNVLHQYCDR